MKDVWPHNVIGHQQYHLTVDRAGHLISRVPLNSRVDFDNNHAEFERCANALVSYMSKAGMFAVPAVSKLERWHIDLTIGNYHDLNLKN